MAWNMTPIDAPASSVRLPLDQIPADVRDSVEEAFAFCQENPGKRLLAEFETEADRDANRTAIRSYCEARPAGRLTASIWSGFTGAEATDNGPVTRWSANTTELCGTPALSLSLVPYVKRSKTAAPAATEPAPAA